MLSIYTPCWAHVALFRLLQAKTNAKLILKENNWNTNLKETERQLPIPNNQTSVPSPFTHTTC